jgi:drug/metabolite transporter (DMT)-like permease
MPRQSVTRGALAALALLSLIWSYNWVVMKQALAWTGPFEFAAWRAGLGTLMLFALLRWRGQSLAPPRWKPLLLVAIAQTLGFQALVQWALVDGGAGRTALLAYTMPFWVVLLAWWLLRDRPSRWQWASLALAFAGLLFLLEPWKGMGGSQSTLLAIGGGLCWAVGVVLSKRMFQRGEARVLQLTAWQMAIGTVGLVLVALAVDEPPMQWNSGLVLALAYNGVLASGLAWLLWGWLVEQLPAQVAGVSSLVIPILGVLFAWWVLHEAPDGAEWTGIALLVAALAVVGRRPPRGAGPDRVTNVT